MITLLDTIPGINRRIAEIVLAEIGTDLSRFPSAAHLASWAGMCPGNQESAGKHLSGRMRKKYFDERDHSAVTRRAVRRLEQSGYQVELVPVLSP